MSCCVGQASLGVHLTVCVVCYAAKDWLRWTCRSRRDNVSQSKWKCPRTSKSLSMYKVHLSVCQGA